MGRRGIPTSCSPAAALPRPNSCGLCAKVRTGTKSETYWSSDHVSQPLHLRDSAADEVAAAAAVAHQAPAAAAAAVPLGSEEEDVFGHGCGIESPADEVPPAAPPADEDDEDILGDLLAQIDADEAAARRQVCEARSRFSGRCCCYCQRHFCSQ